MKQARLLLTIIFTLFASTIYAQMTAIAFNDKMADITDSMYQKGGQWGEQFQTIYGGSKQFSELKTIRLEIQLFVARQINELKSMKDVHGSYELRNETIKFLEFEDKLVVSAFMPIEKLSPSSSDAEIEKAIQNLTKQVEGEDEALKKLQAAQTAYAKKNGFEIAEAAEE